MTTTHRFEKKSILVTGAASGIGLATAIRFAHEGGQIAMVDINSDHLEKASRQVREAGASHVITLTCDVSKEDQVESTVKKTLEKFDGLHVVINNAGVMAFKPLQEHTLEDWQKVLGVDLLGTFFFTKQAFLHMKKGGAIVNVSSIHAVETTPLVTSYAAAKSAVLSLTRSAALEGKAKGIRVNAILPGAIDTPMLWDNPNIKAGLEVIKKSDVGHPENVASAIAYLASDDAAFIQGAMLRVDGGRLDRL